jgi:uncharacterized protein (DUF58 family)
VSAAEFQQSSRRLAALAARVAGSGWLRRQPDTLRALDRTDYVAGDDYRQIDWNVCARHDELRSFPAARSDEPFVYLLVDCSRSMNAAEPTKFTVARDWAFRLASMALAGGAATVGAAAITERVESELRPVRGRSHAAALARFFTPLAAGAPSMNLQSTSSQSTNLQSAMQDFLRLRRPPGLAIVVSDFLDARGFSAALDLLRQARFEPFVAHVVSPQDAEPDWQGALELEDAETGARRRFVARPADLLRYRRHFARFCASLEHYCSQHRLGWLRIDTALGVDAALRQIMRPGIWSAEFRRRV